MARMRTALELVASASCCVALVSVFLPARREEIVLLGSASIPGDMIDKSGLSDKLDDGTPHKQLGGIGSGIAHTGWGDRYVVVADRGPKDGAVAYHCRTHVLQITIDGRRKPTVTPRLLETNLLVDETGQVLVGCSTALKNRYDPEGIRVGGDGTIFVVDEYGPSLDAFRWDVKRMRSFAIPEKFLAASLHGDPKLELQNNSRGRVPNRGFEGLAITPDSDKLYAVMQSPLIQDGARDGVNVRLLELDIPTGATREFVYTLDHPDNGISEILAVSEHTFLVIERDGKEGHLAKFKRLFRIDTRDSTDVSALPSLPKLGLPPDVKSVSKQLFIDVLDDRFGLAGAQFPGKIEGLTFGPDLPDGRRLLLITSDNDFHTAAPTWIFAFAIDPKKLAN